MSRRPAYPGIPATEIIKQLGFSGPLMDALKDVRLDGEQLLGLADTLRTPRRFEMRAETKYREAFAAAVAFAALMDYKDVAISSVHPDARPRFVTESMDGAQKRRQLPRFFDLGAEPVNVHVNRPLVTIEVEAPDPLQEPVARERNSSSQPTPSIVRICAV